MAEEDVEGKDLPFRAEYAKSGRASCRGCKDSISQGSLRLAVMVQSPHFDGKMPMWYHSSCFWKKSRVNKVEDIHGYHSLRWEDQEKIQSQISGGGGAATGATASGKGKGKGKKAAAAAAPVDTSASAAREYKVEYAKSGGSKCRACEDKIPKGEVRLGKMEYESEQARMYGPQTLWHHVQCFVDKRVDLGFTTDLSIETAAGFSSIEKEDQQRLLTLLGKGERPKSVTNVNQKDSSETAKPAKGRKRKAEKEDVADQDAEQEKKPKAEADDLAAKMKTQNADIWKVRDALEASGLSSRDMKDLLELNDQDVPETGRLIERLADCVLFGATCLCPECKNGHLVFSDTANAYRCTGQITEWAKCAYTTKTPKRKKLQIPDDLQDVDMFKKYKYVARERVFPPDRVQAPKKEAAESSVDASKPLSLLKFVIAGRTSRPINDLRQALVNLGATIAADVDGTVIALVVSTSEAKKASKSKHIAAAETADIHVVDETFVTSVCDAAKNGALKVVIPDPAQSQSPPDGVINLVDLIKKHTVINTCGGSVESRIRLNLAKSAGLVGATKSLGKSAGSAYTKSVPDTKKFKVKGRSAVDPDSGLEDEAHVLDESGVIWTCVLNLVSVASGANSYYRLQLLESDNKGNKWWVFRAWGRIGTTIGGTKVQKFSNKQDAKDDFCELFLDKTGHPWNNGKFSREKVPGKFFLVDVDFGVDPSDDSKLLSLDTAGSQSKLPPSVKDLIRLIFDVKMMKKIMAEMEIDLKKMPLGRLSKNQITQAYKVLSELQAVIEKPSSSSGNRQYSFIDGSNKFFSLIPHDFGMNSPPLIDTLKAVQEKTTMLDELMQIEYAYRMLSEDGGGKEDPLDVHYKQLNTAIVPVDRDSDEFKLLEKYVQNTHAATHSQYKLVVADIFRIDREGESSRFKPFHKMPNHKLLWHGSRLTNFVGILSQGLRIAPPEAPVTGYMFGKGVYFADMVSKSANYCYTSSLNNTGLLLLSDVALGKVHDVSHATAFSKPPSGFDSVRGVGRTLPDPAGSVKLPVTDGYEIEVPCGKPKDLGAPGGSLLYNEFIVYDVLQIRLRYLLRLEFKYKV